MGGRDWEQAPHRTCSKAQRSTAMKRVTHVMTILILLWSRDAGGASNRRDRINARSDLPDHNFSGEVHKVKPLKTLHRMEVKSKVSGGEKIVGGETVIPNSIPYQVYYLTREYYTNK